MYNPNTNRWNIWSERGHSGHWNWHYRTNDPYYYNPFTHGQNPNDYGMTPAPPVPVGDIPVLLFIGLAVLYVVWERKQREVGLFIK